MKYSLICTILVFSFFSKSHATPLPTDDSEIKEIKNSLRYLRNGAESYEIQLSSLREKIRTRGYSYASIGTSEKEIESLRILGAKMCARMWLFNLRKGSDRYEHSLFNLREEVRKGNFTLMKIGTSEDELKRLRILGAKTAAKKWLSYLRRGSARSEHFATYIRKEARKGGLTLAEVGTTEDELSSFEKKKST